MATKEVHCDTCGLTGGWSCIPATWHDDAGEPVEAIPYDGASGERCPECGVRPAGYHHVGCSLEEIPEQLRPTGALLPDPAVPESAPAPVDRTPFGLTGRPANVNPLLWNALLGFGAVCAAMLSCAMLAGTAFLYAILLAD